jgi:hypothetical protein
MPLKHLCTCAECVCVCVWCVCVCVCVCVCADDEKGSVITNLRTLKRHAEPFLLLTCLSRTKETFIGTKPTFVGMYFFIIGARPSKQPLTVSTFLKVYMELGSYFCFCKNK